MADRHELANRMERDRAELERIGIRAARRIGRRTRIDAVKAFARGGNAAALDATSSALNELRPLLADAMIAGYLKGRRRVVLTAREHFQQVRLSAYDGAIEFLRGWSMLQSRDIDALRQRFGRDVSNTMNVLQRHISDELNSAQVVRQAAEQGQHVRGGVRRLRQAFDKAGLTPENSYTLENLFRTQVQTAYAAGRWQTLRSTEVDDILWGFEYVTVGDNRVRPAHAAMDGIRLPKDHPFWQTNFPPNGYSCRCAAIEIFEGDAAARPDRERLPVPREIDGATVEPNADRGFRFNPGMAFDREAIAPPTFRRPSGLGQDENFFRQQSQFIKGVTDEERAVLDAWTNERFYAIRAADRGKPPDDLAVEQLGAMRSLTRRAPRWKGTVYRGLGALPVDVYRKLTRVGDVYQEPAIASASKSVGRGREYMFVRSGFTDAAGNPERNVLVEIRTKRGRDISQVSPVRSDREVLILKSHRYRIISVEERHSNVTGQRVEYTHVIVEDES